MLNVMKAACRKLICATAAVLASAAMSRVPGAASNQASNAQLPDGPDKPFFEAYGNAQPMVAWPLKKILHEIPEIKGLKPSSDQSLLAPVMARASARLTAFWQDFENTSSLETIEVSRQRINPPTDDVDRAVQQFRYLMLTDPQNPQRIMEYRTDLQGHARSAQPGTAGFLETSGFASLPLLFGAQDQQLSDFRDLGSQSVHGRNCEVICFAQHVVPSAALSRWSIGRGTVPVLLQGVGWIDAASGQIVEIRTDLLAPQPGVGLRRATTIATFEPIQFRNAAGTVWLPSEVTVTVDLDNHTFVNRHRYSDYQRFTVSTGGKQQNPTAP